MDVTTKTQILILIVGVLIGGGLYLTNSLYLWNTSVDKDKAEIAGGISLDIESLEEYLLTTDQAFLANAGEQYVFVQATPRSIRTMACTSPTSGISPRWTGRSQRTHSPSIITFCRRGAGPGPDL